MYTTDKAEGSSTTQSKSKVVALSKFMILVVLVYLGTLASLQVLRFALGTEDPIRVVEGISMEKTYYDGDLVILRGIPKEDIKIGDVIVYQRSAVSISIIHRVIDKRLIAINSTWSELYFITQGDNRVSNPSPDSPVPAGSVKGVVIVHVPAIGRVVWALRTPVGLVFSGALIVIILLFDVFGEGDNKPKTGNAL